MRKFTLLFIGIAFAKTMLSQINPAEAYPELFKAVQSEEIFQDQKKFTDCIPLCPTDTIVQKFQRHKRQPGFDLKDFVGTHFDTLLFDTANIFRHIDNLWDALLRYPDTIQQESSLIPLPYPYIVPGGRFREIYYWDSYFTLLGLAVSQRYDIIQNMLLNFAYLIDQYGHVPNGNRSYYLSRSQPPFFSLMVELYAQHAGDSALLQFLPQMQKEYDFWMDGRQSFSEDRWAIKRVVLLDGQYVLNRYWDEKQRPRPESYLYDWHTFDKAGRDSSIFREIRAAAESGWDFSSRWFKGDQGMTSIHTTDMVPVDLNCLLYHLEKTLMKAYTLKGDHIKAEQMAQQAQTRARLIIEYCWDAEKGFFFDYDHKKGERTGKASMAGVYPLFFQIANDNMAHRALDRMESELLFPGGLAATPVESGQQWDYPNGWAPLQWIGYKACENYGRDSLAQTIARRWTDLNIKVFFETGKMMEKYNVVDITLPGGGGEYELQDGFGWTNGVFLSIVGSSKTSAFPKAMVETSKVEK
jgi:alpha,alpha-trehalase